MNWIHPKVKENYQFQIMKEVVINNFKLTPHQIVQVLKCNYRMQLFTIIKKLDYECKRIHE